MLVSTEKKELDFNIINPDYWLEHIHITNVAIISTVYHDLHMVPSFTIDAMYDDVANQAKGLSQKILNEFNETTIITRKEQIVENYTSNYIEAKRTLEQNKPVAFIYNESGSETKSGGSHWYSIVISKEGDEYTVKYFNSLYSRIGSSSIGPNRKILNNSYPNNITEIIKFIEDADTFKTSALNAIQNNNQFEFHNNNKPNPKINFTVPYMIIQEDRSLCGVASTFNSLMSLNNITLKKDAVFKKKSPEVKRLRLYFTLLEANQINAKEALSLIISDELLPINQCLESKRKLEGFVIENDRLKEIQNIIAAAETAYDDVTNSVNLNTTSNPQNDIQSQDQVQKVGEPSFQNKQEKPQLKHKIIKKNNFKQEIITGSVVTVLSAIAVIIVISFNALALLALVVPVLVIGASLFAKGLYDYNKGIKSNVVPKSNELLKANNEVSGNIVETTQKPEISQRQKLSRTNSETSTSKKI